MSYVCIDGEFFEANEAKVSVFDHGFLYGDGLFETMRSYGGKVFALKEHLERLRRGAEVLKLSINESDEKIAGLLYQTLKVNKLKDAYIRLTFSRGPGEIGLDPSLCPKGTLVIMAKPLKGQEELYQHGISLGISPIRRNHPTALVPSVKSLNFLNNILAKMWAKEQGFFEALLLSQEGWVTETTVSNIFFVQKGMVCTPDLRVGILSGVTRAYTLRAVKSESMAVEEGFFTLENLLQAEEVFLTNSGSEIIPVVKLDNQIVGDGMPGKLTKKIHNALKQIINLELGK